jgi:hypothetical protein
MYYSLENPKLKKVPISGLIKKLEKMSPLPPLSLNGNACKACKLGNEEISESDDPKKGGLMDILKKEMGDGKSIRGEESTTFDVEESGIDFVLLAIAT